MKKLLIIKTGTTFPGIRQAHGDFEDLVINQAGLTAADALVTPVYERQALPPARDVAAVIITGSHAMVTDKDAWSIYLARWLHEERPRAVPVLGICYGHQLLAAAWGGAVDYHQRGSEVGAVDITLTDAGVDDPLLGCLPPRFIGYAAHAQTVTQLPPGARLLAYNAFEPHHAFVVDGNVWGVQFHPEFTAPVMQAYIDAERDERVLSEQDAAQRRETVRQQAAQTEAYGRRLLRRFLALVS